MDFAGPVTAKRFLRGGRLAILEFEYQEFLYDREAGELLSGAGDLLEWSHDEDHGRFAVDEPFPEAVQVLGQDGSATIYRYDRTSPETKDGRPYLHLVRGIPDQDVQYYYRIDEGKLTLGDGYSSMQMVIIVREKKGRRASWRGEVFR